jgi:hypothetical protein
MNTLWTLPPIVSPSTKRRTTFRCVAGTPQNLHNCTPKPFFRQACTEVAECCMMTPCIAGSQAPVHRLHSDTSCLHRYQLELYLWSPVSSKLTGMNMRRLFCVLHSQSTAQFGYLFHRAFLLCCVSGRFFRY